MKRITLVMLLMVATLAHAHGAENLSIWQRLGIPDPVTIATWSAAVAAFFLVASLYYRRVGEQAKKILFLGVVLPVIVATLYLGASTIYLNIKSATGGPVHWHADYEIWACGQEYELVDPEGIINRVGSETVHEHNDNRIHIEGVLMEMEEASVGEYFEKIGGSFTGTSLSIRTNEGPVSWSDGDLCNGQPAKWYMFVNGVLEEDAPDHIIAPYPDVPPGDMLKIVFTEKPLEEINTKLFEVP